MRVDDVAGNIGDGPTTRGSSVAYQCGTLSSGVNPMIFIPFSFDAIGQGPTQRARRVMPG